MKHFYADGDEKPVPDIIIYRQTFVRKQTPRFIEFVFTCMCTCDWVSLEYEKKHYGIPTYNEQVAQLSQRNRAAACKDCQF